MTEFKKELAKIQRGLSGSAFLQTEMRDEIKAIQRTLSIIQARISKLEGSIESTSDDIKQTRTHIYDMREKVARKAGETAAHHAIKQENLSKLKIYSVVWVSIIGGVAAIIAALIQWLGK